MCEYWNSASPQCILRLFSSCLVQAGLVGLVLALAGNGYTSELHPLPAKQGLHSGKDSGPYSEEQSRMCEDAVWLRTRQVNDQQRVTPQTPVEEKCLLKSSIALVCAY
jgi:hypothetical protein